MAPSGHSVAQSTVQRPLSNPTSVHNALVRLHRWLGLATMFFLIAAGLSGSALVFRAELDAALNILYRAETDYMQAKYDYANALFKKAITQNQVSSVLNLLK